MRPFYYALSFLLTLALALPAGAETLTASFDDIEELPDGWVIVGNINVNDDRGRNNTASIWSSGKSATDNYFATTPVKGSLSFYWRSYGTSGSYPNGQVYVYQYDNDALGQLLWTSSSYKGSTWRLETVSLGDYEGSVAIALYSACLDDMTYTPVEVEAVPVLQVSGQPSGSLFNFDDTPVPAGTAKSFRLTNRGGQDLSISSITASGGYTVTRRPESAVIAPQASDTVTIVTPDSDAEGQLTITSDDVNSPYVIFLSSRLKVPAPVMGVSETAIAFGLVAEDAVRTVEVTNTGDADLVADLVSDNDDFTVSTASLTVKAGERATFDVTFRYRADSPGLHAATITLTPNAGQPVTISVSARIVDSNAWQEDFSANALPEGWGADEKCWTFADGVAHASYGGYSDAYKYFLTTPALTVADTGDALTFQAKSTGIYTSIKVTMSKDGSDFVSYKTFSLDDDMDDFATFTIDGLQPGTYLFRFANDSYDLDNFAGLKLSTKSHDAVISSVDIPAEGLQYCAYEASVSVRELAGQTETVSVRYFVGEQQQGETVTETIDARATKTFTVRFTPQQPLSGDAYFTVTSDDIALTSAKTAVSIEKAPTLSEASGAMDDFENWGRYSMVALEYTMTPSWSTIILPFAVSDLSVFGSNAVFYELSDCAGNSLKFTRVTRLNPQQPYLYYTDTERSLFLFYDIDNFRTNSDADYLQTAKGGALFQGFYAPAEAGTLTGKIVVGGQDGQAPQFAVATDETALNGFRAYMEWPSRQMTVYLDGVATGIQNVMRGEQEENRGVYDLQGRQHAAPRKGIFVSNHRLVVRP